MFCDAIVSECKVDGLRTWKYNYIMFKMNFIRLCEAFIPYIIYLAVMELLTILMPVFVGKEAGIAMSVAGQLIMIPVFIFILFKEKRLADTFRWNNKFLNDILIPVIAGAFIGALVTFAVSVSGVGADADFLQAQEVYRQNIVLTMVSSVVLAPLMEEMLFRGMIYHKMESDFGIPVSVVVSSMFFAMGHASLVQVIYGFLMGVLFALLYHKRGTIIAPVAMHAAANLVTILMQM